MIQAGGAATYRFIFANEAKSDAFKQEAQTTVESFKSMSAQELATFNRADP